MSMKKEKQRTKVLAKYIELVIKERNGRGLLGGEIVLYLAEDIMEITNPLNAVKLTCPPPPSKPAKN